MRLSLLVATATAFCLSACATVATTAAGLPTEGTLAPYLRPAELKLTPVFARERFPNVVVTTQGTVLVTYGSSQVQARRSEDGGVTFGQPIPIGKGIHGGGTTVDEQTGHIFAFVEERHPPAPIAVFRSRDDGRTWERATVALRANTLGHVPSMHMNEHGITLRHGPHAGRIVRASRHYAGGNDAKKHYPEHYTNAIYSDDGGQTWQASEPFPERGTGEATLVERADGTLYYNSRVHWGANPKWHRRRSAISRDGGVTWQDFRVETTLPDGVQDNPYGCMGGLTRLAVRGRDVLVFSNIDVAKGRRRRVTVWASFDGGRTWPMRRLAFAGGSAYSSLTSGRPGTPTEGWIYLHFEGGPKGGSTVARFNLAWLLAGKPTGDGVVPEWARGSVRE